MRYSVATQPACDRVCDNCDSERRRPAGWRRSATTTAMNETITTSKLSTLSYLSTLPECLQPASWTIRCVSSQSCVTFVRRATFVTS